MYLPAPGAAPVYCWKPVAHWLVATSARAAFTGIGARRYASARCGWAQSTTLTITTAGSAGGGSARQSPAFRSTHFTVAGLLRRCGGHRGWCRGGRVRGGQRGCGVAALAAARQRGDGKSDHRAPGRAAHLHVFTGRRQPGTALPTMTITMTAKVAFAAAGRRHHAGRRGGFRSGRSAPVRRGRPGFRVDPVSTSARQVTRCRRDRGICPHLAIAPTSTTSCPSGRRPRRRRPRGRRGCRWSGTPTCRRGASGGTAASSSCEPPLDAKSCCRDPARSPAAPGRLR